MARHAGSIGKIKFLELPGRTLRHIKFLVSPADNDLEGVVKKFGAATSYGISQGEIKRCRK
jgi:hypothetical protein